MKHTYCPTKIEDWFRDREEARLEKLVKKMRTKGISEDRISRHLNYVASVYLAELSRRYDENAK